MKTLFAGFLTVSISGSIILCMVLLLRLTLKKAPKSLVCVLWLLAILRLLLPFQIENPISLRPETPVLAEYDTQLFINSDPVSAEGIPGFIPQKVVDSSVFHGDSVVIDYVSIGGTVWGVVAFGMLLYMVISYWRLKLRVKEAICVGSAVYTSSNLRTAFLLGYIRPRIYLPSDISGREMELVIAHEQAHKKRGDNWLKLLGFICLAVHWYNPLVWISYFLLCRDIEDACDELVIRDLQEADRKAYSSALLSCGRERVPLAACPVAFGEISIKQRILNVLNYRKPTLWICVLAVIVIVLAAVFFMTDPLVQKHPPMYDELTQLLGEPKATVLDELGITEADIEGGTSLYTGMTPIQVEYQNITFNLFLFFDRANNELGSFSYMASYPDSQQAAEDALKLSRHFWKCYGEGYQADHRDNADRLSRITLEEIQEMFKNPRRAHVGISSLGDTWDITDQAGSGVKAHLKEYEQSEVWQLSYGPEGEFKDEMATPCWRFTFEAWSDADPDSDVDSAPAYITLGYKKSINRDRGAYIAATFGVEQSWWEKLWNWLR